MNIDLEAIKTAVQQFMQDQEILALVGRNVLILVWMCVTGVLGYFVGKLGLGTLRLASWGARACWKSSPDTLMGRQLGEAILTSLQNTTQPPINVGLRTIDFAKGYVLLDTGIISLDGKSVEKLLPRREVRRILKEGRIVLARLEHKKALEEKQSLLNVLKPPQVIDAQVLSEPSREELLRLHAAVFGAGNSKGY